MIGEGKTRFDGFDDKIISLYARGTTVREIQGHLAELYGTEVVSSLTINQPSQGPLISTAAPFRRKTL